MRMDAEFWQERWQAGEIGFHQKQVHRFLPEQLTKLKLAPGGRVLVPLCGKSLDLVWLAGQGFEVVGVELSRLAVEAFFTEQLLAPQRTSRGPFEIWQQGSIKLLAGDLFDLTTEECGPLAAVYDRAALVALPQEMRPRYAAKLAELLPGGGKLLLISYAYRQDEMAGPPFTVPFSEIKLLFGGAFDIELLHEEDALASHPGIQARGVSVLWEFCCRLTRL